MSFRFALLQARKPGDRVRGEERESFAEQLQVDIDRILAVDIFSDPLSPALLDEVDAVLVGGSGDFSVNDDLPGIRGLVDFMGLVVDRGFPTFASCFGFQAMVVALGGTVVPDEPNAEVGTFQVHVTEEGARDPVFATAPTPFWAQLGHKERCEVLPPRLERLAWSERCPVQAVRVPGRPVYATQFHPELSDVANRTRFERYFALYQKVFGPAGAREMLDSFRESPHASALLRHFVAECLGGN